MSDTYLNHYRHLTFSIHRHTHNARLGNCSLGGETVGERGKAVG